MNTLFKLGLLISITSLVLSCSARMNGSSLDDYKRSRDVMEKTLDQDERVLLEKATQIIGITCMYLHGENPDYSDFSKYPSYLEVYLERVDGLTYGQLLALAESDIPVGRDWNIKKVNKEIERLEKRKIILIADSINSVQMSRLGQTVEEIDHLINQNKDKLESIKSFQHVSDYDISD